MRNPIALLALVSCAAIACGATAMAASDGTADSPDIQPGAVSIAGQLGAGFSNNGVGGNFAYGVTLDYAIAPPILVGVFVDHMGLGSISNSAITLNDSSHSITFFGIEGVDRLDSILPGLGVGLKLGFDTANVRATAPGIFNDTKSNLNVFAGPKISYDVPLANRISVGGEANVLFKTTSDEPIAGYTTVNQVSSIVNLLGTVKYTF